MNKITLDFFQAKSKTTIKGLVLLFALFLMNTQTWGQTPVPMSSQIGLSYTENFADITNWTSKFEAGTGANRWASYPVTSGGTANDGKRTTISSAAFTSGTSGGVQKGTGNLVFLSIGSAPTSGAVAVDFLMDFTGVNAGTLSFNWAAIDNSSGTRPTSLRVFWSTDNTTFTEITAAQIIDIQSVSSGSITTVALPANFNNSATARLRFYNHAGTVTGSGNRDKISIDDVTVTAVSSGLTPPTLTAAIGATVDSPFNITFTDDAASQAWVNATTTSVTIGGTALTAGYSIANGIITFTPSASVPVGLLQTAGANKPIIISKTGYANATVTQTINAGAPTANSTATISAALSPNTNRTITCTAKDQYNNLVSGYTFGYDVTITNNDGTTAESYTIDASPFTATSTGNPVMTNTNASGVATFAAVLPATIDPSDGIAIQVQLNDDSTNIGSTFSFTQLAAQNITFNALTPVTYGDATFDLTATASSSLPVSYSSSNTNVATISGSTVTIVGAGSTNITASQAGNGSYYAAVNVIQALAVNPKALTIPSAAAASRVYNGLLTTNITGTLLGIINADDVTLVGTLKGTFADANVANGISVTSACTLSGTKAGNYVLTQPTGLTANITQASQTITFGALANKVVGDASFTLSGTASSALTVTYTSSNTAVATVSGNTVSIVGEGSTNITASQAGNINYTAATDVVQSLTVKAGLIAAWDFFGQSSPATFAATTFDANLVSTSNTITRGAGASSSTGGNSFRTQGFQNNGISTSNNDYFQITIQASAGKTVSLSTIDANFAGTGTFAASPGVSSQFAYSLDGTSFTLIGSAAVTIGTPATLTQIDLSAITALQNVASGITITLRYYASGQTTTGGWGFNSATAGTNGLAIGGTIQTVSTTWNGSAWSNGTPTASLEAIIDGTYLTKPVIDGGNGTFTAKKLTVTAAGSLTINSGTNLTVQNEVINNGTLVVENNANLIQVNTVANTGSITVNRDSNTLFRSDYTLWSSPVTADVLTNQTLLSFSPLTAQTPNNRFYTYNPTSNLYSSIAASSKFSTGIGYLIRMPHTGTTNYNAGSEAAIHHGVFTGVPFNDNLTLTVTSGSYNAIGNPYPSTLSADAFITANSITEALYFWRKTNNPNQATAPTTSYATYTLAGGVGTLPGSSSITPNGTIQVGQGFIAKSTSTSLVFTNLMRTGNNSNQFLKTKKIERNRIWLNLTNTAGAFSQMMVAYMDGATSGIDAGIDGRFFNDTKTALNSFLNNEEFVIQGRALPFDGTDVVSLAFKTETDGDYTIAIDHTDGFFANGQDIYLVDNSTGVETNLKDTAYTFNAAAGTDNARFSLKFQKTLKVDDPTFNENTVTVYQKNGTVYINSKTVGINNVKVFDLQGRLLNEQKNLKTNTAIVSNFRAKNQILIVKVVGENNSEVSKKIMN